MALRLVFMGRLETVAGSGERAVPFAAALDTVLAALEPALADALTAGTIRLAVNGALVNDTAALVLRDGDELAFLPPVSGG